MEFFDINDKKIKSGDTLYLEEEMLPYRDIKDVNGTLFVGIAKLDQWTELTEEFGCKYWEIV